MSRELNSFCETFNTDKLKNIKGIEKELLIDTAFSCLFQKNGNQTIAKKILVYFKLIKIVKGSCIYIGDKNINNNYQKLKRTGVVSIPVLDKKQLDNIHKELDETLLSFPEYNRDSTDKSLDKAKHKLVYVLGGFAAFANPGSFHNPLVRKLRIMCKEKILPLFKIICKNTYDKETKNNFHLEVLIDRLMYRLAQQSPSAESWHRDVIPPELITDNDELYGGWLNLDIKEQYFSCIPGSHLGVKLKTLKPGFATIPKDDIQKFNMYKDKFTVPPGHLIIFPQYILHEVVSKKVNYIMKRLFIGWRTTNEKTFLHKDMLERLQTQDIIPLPSGQLPPMYASNHGSFFLNKQFKPDPSYDYKVNTIEWSQNTMKPVTLLTKVNKDKKEYKIVNRFLKSLEEYNLKKYKEYTEEEINFYKPTKVK